jgi:hypothetical protein
MKLDKAERKAFNKAQKELNDYTRRGKESQERAQAAFDKKWKAGNYKSRESSVGVKNSSFLHYHDEGYEPYDDDNLIEVEFERKEREKRERKQFWNDNSRVLKESFLKSFEIFGQPPEYIPCFNSHQEKLSTCGCVLEKHQITITMLFGRSFYLRVFIVFKSYIGQIEADINYCSTHRPLLQTLILLQILPSATSSPKSGFHFSVFEFATFAKLDGFMSNYAITKVLNNYNMQKHNFKVS